MAKTYNPIMTMTDERLALIKEYLADKKIVNQTEFGEFLRKLFNLGEKKQAGASKANYVKNRYPELFEGKTLLRGPAAVRFENITELLKDETFKKLSDAKLKSLGVKDIFKLTNDQQDTIIDSYTTAVRNNKLIPKNAIPESDFLNKAGITKSNMKAYLGKDTRLGNEFRKIFEPSRVVIKNKEAFYKPEGLDDKIKEWKTFRDEGYLQEGTIKRANVLKNNPIIQRYLENNDKNLFNKEGRNAAFKALGKDTTNYQASHALSTLARGYAGEKLSGLNVTPSKSKADFIWKNLISLKERDSWSAPNYAEGLRQVDKELKGVGKFRTFKTSYTKTMKDLFKEMGIPKKYLTSINEIVPVKGAYRNNIAPYSSFVDLTRKNLNRYIAQHQSGLSKAINYLDNVKKGSPEFKAKIARFSDTTLPKSEANVIKKFGKDAVNQVRLATLVEGTDLTSGGQYKQVDLDRWKKSGLDLQKYADEKGYFIDTKNARPFFEVTKDDLRKAVKNLTKKEQILYCSRLSAGGLPGDCARAIDDNPLKAAQVFDEAPATSTAMTKVKNAASTFLNVAKKGGRFGAFAAAGAATAGLVKEFRNDDPSTYLSNENQQKNMLIDMITQPVSAPGLEEKTTAFGDAQLPAIGAVTAAGMVPGGAELYRQRTGSGVRKGPLGGPRLDADKLPIPKNRVSPVRAALGPLSGVLGKGLAATGTPLGMLALEPLYIGQQIADGDSAGEIATNPLNYLGPAFAGSLSKEATRFAGPTMSNIMRLGISPTTLKTVSRRFGIPGLALSAGMSGYEMYQNKKAGRGLFDDG